MTEPSYDPHGVGERSSKCAYNNEDTFVKLIDRTMEAPPKYFKVYFSALC